MKEQIKQIMAAVLGLDETHIADDASPETIAEWDSLKQMNIVVALEDEFGVEFSDEEITEMLSLPLIEIIVKEKFGG